MPDVGALIDLIQPFQPAQGPMTTPAGRVTAASGSRPGDSTLPVATPPGEALEAAIERLEGTGASRHIREAADGLRAMGYELRLARTTIPASAPRTTCALWTRRIPPTAWAT